MSSPPSGPRNLPVTAELRTGLRAAFDKNRPGHDFGGPLEGRYRIDIEGGFAQTGTARIYYGEHNGQEWALAAFGNKTTGTMHQPGVYRKDGSAWVVVTEDPAPGEYGLHGIPEPLMRLWGMKPDEVGMWNAPKDAVTSDAFPH